VPLSPVDPETGEMSPATCYAHACLVAEVEVDDETGEKLLKLIDLLNEHDDVQNVYANFEVSDALMQKMSA